MTDNSDSDDEEVSQLTTASSRQWIPIDNMGRGAQIPLIRPTPVRPQPPRSPPRKRRSRNYGDKPKRTQGGRRKRRKKKRTRKKRKKRTRRRRRKKGRKTKRKR